MIFMLRLLVIATVVVTLFSCSEKQFTPLPIDATIVAFGDSLTFGVGASVGNDYPAVLAELSGATVINSGISGETTEQGLIRFEQVIMTHSPDLIILFEGGNDILQNKSLESIKINLESMIKLARLNNIQILLIGVPEKKLFSSSAPIYQQLADEYSIVFDKDSLSDLLRTTQYKSDPVHLNNAGYKKLAKNIYQQLKDYGAL